MKEGQTFSFIMKDVRFCTLEEMGDGRWGLINHVSLANVNHKHTLMLEWRAGKQTSP